MALYPGWDYAKSNAYEDWSTTPPPTPNGNNKTFTDPYPGPPEYQGNGGGNGGEKDNAALWFLIGAGLFVILLSGSK